MEVKVTNLELLQELLNRVHSKEIIIAIKNCEEHQMIELMIGDRKGENSKGILLNVKDLVITREGWHLKDTNDIIEEIKQIIKEKKQK